MNNILLNSACACDTIPVLDNYFQSGFAGNRNLNLKETYMVDFIVNLFAEIADFFITFWVDNVIDKFAKRN